MVYPYPTGGRTPRTPQGGQEKANLGSTVQKAVPPKDLINLRSPSGEVYRFAWCVGLNYMLAYLPLISLAFQCTRFSQLQALTDKQ